ncbi:TasA family protein [Bacillus sp. JJ1533]|uniref:TasA family protein n=1 Tax=Bacillus sp. JJ1533 TaxID=3122959 RepID=UPI002FFF035C
MSVKKKIGFGIASLALGAALIGGGTYAYFNDVETSSGNTFATGTIELEPNAISTNKIDWSNKKPGDTFSYTFPLQNTGTLNANLFIDIINYNSNGNGDNTDLGEVLHITELSVGGTNYLNQFDANTDGTVTLKEFADGAKLQFGEINSGETKNMTVSGLFFESGSPQNEYQGDSLTLDVEFELRQQ